MSAKEKSIAISCLINHASLSARARHPGLSIWGSRQLGWERKWRGVKHGYQHSLLGLRGTQFRDKFLEQVDIYPNENQMINAQRIFFLWNSFSSSIYSAGVNFPSSILFSFWKQRPFLLIRKLYFTKDEDNALGLEIPFSNNDYKRFSCVVTMKGCENISSTHGGIYYEPMCVAEEKQGKPNAVFIQTSTRILCWYYFISKHKYLESNTDMGLGRWLTGQSTCHVNVRTRV